MLRYCVHRLLISCVALVGLSMLVFLIVRLTPGAVGTSVRFDAGVYRSAGWAKETSRPRRGYVFVDYWRWLTSLVVDERWSDAVVTSAGQQVFVDSSAGGRLLVASGDGGWSAFFPHLVASGEMLQHTTDGFAQLGDRVVMAEGRVGLTVVIKEATAPVPLGLRVKEWRLTLGRSAAGGRPVVDEIGQRIRMTLVLNGLALIGAWAASLGLGILMASGRRRWWNRAIHGALMAVWSVPVVLAATLVIAITMALGGGRLLAPLTDSAWNDAGIGALLLPVVCLSYVPMVYLARQWCTALEKELASDYVKTALAKGASRRRVMFGHVLRNALPSMIVLWAGSIAYTIVGSAIVETAFGINGMGRLAVQAARDRDAATVQAMALIVGVLHITAVLVGDVLCRAADPRILYGSDAALARGRS